MIQDNKKNLLTPCDICHSFKGRPYKDEWLLCSRKAKAQERDRDLNSKRYRREHKEEGNIEIVDPHSYDDICIFFKLKRGMEEERDKMDCASNDGYIKSW